MSHFLVFGENLKKLRTERNLTQKELGDRIGISKAVVSKYENSIGYPTYDVLIKFAAFFGVTTDYLLGVQVGKVLDISNLTDGQIAAIRHIVIEFEKNNYKTTES